MVKEKVVAIVQARMGSTRFPGKMLAELHGIPIIEWVVERTRKALLLDELLVAIPKGKQDDPLARHLATLGVLTYRGPEQDVLARFHEAALQRKATTVVRICADNPLICPSAIDALIDFFREQSPQCQYAYNHIPQGNLWPDGIGAEICSTSTLTTIHHEAVLPHHREHVFEFLKENPERFDRRTFDPPNPRLARPNIKLDVDHAEDLAKLKNIRISPKADTLTVLEKLELAQT